MSHLYMHIYIYIYVYYYSGEYMSSQLVGVSDVYLVIILCEPRLCSAWFGPCLYYLPTDNNNECWNGGMFRKPQQLRYTP